MNSDDEELEQPDQLIAAKAPSQVSKCTTRKKKKKKKRKKDIDEIYTADEVEEIDRSLFTKLEKEKNARFNWRKIMTMIQLVKALSTREDHLKREVDAEEEKQEKISCWEFRWLNRYVQPPNKYYMTIWTLIALTVNTLSIFLVYYECAFRLKVFDEFGPVSQTFEVILVVEIIVFFFKAYPEKDGSEGFLYPVLTLPKKCCRKK